MKNTKLTSCPSCSSWLCIVQIAQKAPINFVGFTVAPRAGIHYDKGNADLWRPALANRQVKHKETNVPMTTKVHVGGHSAGRTTTTALPGTTIARAEQPAELIEQTLNRAAQEGVRFINLQFTDLMGIVKSVTIPLHQLEDCARNGKWFDGSSIEGFARIAESDMFLMPDLRTFAVLPWERDTFPGYRTNGNGHSASNGYTAAGREGTTAARIISWVYNPNGEIFAGDPRAVLARALDYAAKLGYTYNTGPELEFYLFKPENGRLTTVTHDTGGYFDLSEDEGNHVRKDMVNALEALGIKVETSHHEVGPG